MLNFQTYLEKKKKVHLVVKIKQILISVIKVAKATVNARQVRFMQYETQNLKSYLARKPFRRQQLLFHRQWQTTDKY